MADTVCLTARKEPFTGHNTQGSAETEKKRKADDGTVLTGTQANRLGGAETVQDEASQLTILTANSHLHKHACMLC
jgi:hypothetical protein